MATNRTLLLGIAISLLLHAGLLAMLVRPAAPPAPTAVPDQRRMTVWLTLPPKPSATPVAVLPVPAVPAFTPPLAARPPERKREPKQERQPIPAPARAPIEDDRAIAAGAAPPSPAAPTVTMLPAPAGARAEPSLPADPFAAAPAPAAGQKGQFDVNAAMKSARKLATAKSTRDDPPVAQIYDKPLYGPPTDTPLGKAVARTARSDCKDVAAGTGLLALIIVPAMILTDKKDSGCKW